MIALLVAAVALLAVVTVLTLVLTFAVIRRLRALEERLGGGEGHLPQPGRAIGRFRAATVDGEEIVQSELAVGTTLAVFLSPECPACDDLVGELERDPPADLLAFVAGDEYDDRATRIVAALPEVARVAVVPEDGAATAAFGVRAFPTVVIVEDGLVAAAAHDLGEALARRAVPDRRRAGLAT